MDRKLRTFTTQNIADRDYESGQESSPQVHLFSYEIKRIGKLPPIDKNLYLKKSEKNKLTYNVS